MFFEGSLESLNKVLEEDIRAIIGKNNSQLNDAFNHYFKRLFSDKSVDELLLNTLELIHLSHGNTLVSDCAKALEAHPKKLERLFLTPRHPSHFPSEKSF